MMMAQFAPFPHGMMVMPRMPAMPAMPPSMPSNPNLGYAPHITHMLVESARGGRGSNVFFKTRLCNKWRSGRCAFGDKCTYAHGQHELRYIPPELLNQLEREQRVAEQQQQQQGPSQQQQPEGLLAAAVARDSPSGDIESSLSAAFLPEERPSSSLGSGKFRIWIDNYSERELVPGTGIWLVRYRELQQRFPPAAAMAGSSGVGRSARWSSAVLQKGPGNTGYQWLYVHETWIEPPAASDPPPVLA